MSIQRILVVFAAVMIVCAVALGTLDTRPRALGQMLHRYDPDMLGRLQGVAERCCGLWVWTDLAMPLMRRPAWLIPVALALIAVGLAFSLSSRKSTHQSRRRS